MRLNVHIVTLVWSFDDNVQSVFSRADETGTDENYETTVNNSIPGINTNGGGNLIL